MTKKYNGDNKKRIRNLIVDKILERKIKSILTLESPDFLFSKMIPNKKIVVWENDSNTFKKMEKGCPKNVELIYGNIGKSSIFNPNIDCIYLDFCKIWDSEKAEIMRLENAIKKSKLFILTLCLRESDYSKENLVLDNKEDYQFTLLRKLQEIIGYNWKLIYGESYYDSVQMITLIFENDIQE